MSKSSIWFQVPPEDNQSRFSRPSLFLDHCLKGSLEIFCLTSWINWWKIVRNIIPVKRFIVSWSRTPLLSGRYSYTYYSASVFRLFSRCRAVDNRERVFAAPLNSNLHTGKLFNNVKDWEENWIIIHKY